MIAPDQIPVAGRPDVARPTGPDLLKLPVAGRLLRWRWGRATLQVVALAIALLLVYDGLTGTRLAAQNLSTVVTWVHLRGLVIITLLVLGNVFCMACPFTLPRSLATRLSGRGRRWPRALRNKWLAVGVFAGFLILYEWLDLWSGTVATAVVILVYFAAAFALESVFAESPFCKYVCPLGTFNFIASTAAPSQITVNSLDTCRDCPGKECVNGSATVLGCGTELFPPTLHSNLDCVLCLDCARACPYDNVAWRLRPPGQELGARAWPRRWDISFLVMLFAFAGLSNAFGMVPPFYELQLALSKALGTQNEALLLFLTLMGLMLVAPAVTGLAAAAASRALAGLHEPLRVSFSRFAPAFVPLAAAIWLAHYLFHFNSGALAVIPVLQNFLLEHGFGVLGEPNWLLGPALPGDWMLPLQTMVILAGLLRSLIAGQRIQRSAEPPVPLLALFPWLAIFVGLATAALFTFNLPMEMRGTVFMGG